MCGEEKRFNDNILIARTCTLSDGEAIEINPNAEVKVKQPNPNGSLPVRHKVKLDIRARSGNWMELRGSMLRRFMTPFITT